MFAFVATRLLQAIPVLLVVGLISFALFAYVGDPVSIILGQDHTEAQAKAMIHQLGLDQPFFVQFARYLWAAMRGEFGISYRLAQPVSLLIKERLPATLELALTATVLSIAIGVPMGVYTGINRTTVLSRLFMMFSLAGVSLPTFLLGILLILVFSVWLGWLPSFGRGDVVPLGAWSTGLLTRGGLLALMLPCVTLGLFQMALILRVVRAEMLQVLASDHIRFARACGLRPADINFDHALRNTLVPVITIIGLQFGNVFAFSIIVETVFQWPGLGLLVIQAIQFADVPLLAGYLVMVALTFALINLAVDIAYAAIDPRVRAT